MIIYNPNGLNINERLSKAEEVLDQIPAKHCFISGSFLYDKKYKDIDVFMISRTKKKINLKDKKITIAMIDFNDLYSLFYHSVSKSCISTGILPKKPLKVTLSDYWAVINEAVPTILNQKNNFHKDIRNLVLYTEYFRTGQVLDTFQLRKKIRTFSNPKKILAYILMYAPDIFLKNMKKSYIKRFFYTQSGFYKGYFEYDAQKYLYALSHTITRQVNG